MVRAIVRKKEDTYLLEISAFDGEKAGLEEGQELELDLPVQQTDAVLDPKIRAIATRIIREHREALDYLAK
jgi:hypothetical protein